MLMAEEEDVESVGVEVEMSIDGSLIRGLLIPLNTLRRDAALRRDEHPSSLSPLCPKTSDILYLNETTSQF